MMDFTLTVLVVILIYLCVKTIKLQGARILKLETFVSEYMDGKREQIHEPHHEKLPSVHAAHQGRSGTSEE